MKNQVLRVIIAVFGILAVLLIGFIIILIAAFSGEGSFYTPYAIVLCILLIAWLIAWASGLLNKKIMRYSFIGIIASLTITLLIYHGHKYYIDSIPVLNEQGVDLTLYEPFEKDSKIARLDEESTLKLQDSLPRINGATALYPLYAAFVQATYPEKDYGIDIAGEVRCGTTPVAYKALFEGKADIIFCAGPSAEQVEEAKSMGLELHLTPIGYEAFVFFVNKKNPVRNLSVEQIQNIYSGKIVNWNEVGGRNEDIRAYQRPKSSGSQTMLETIMQDKPLMNPPAENLVGGMGGIIERTANYKNFGNAIGYSFLFFATEMVKNNDIELLKVNGIQPEKNTIKSKEYPFTGEFYAITTNTRNPNIERFIEWILSPQGQILVEKTGYVPVK